MIRLNYLIRSTRLRHPKTGRLLFLSADGRWVKRPHAKRFTMEERDAEELPSEATWVPERIIIRPEYDDLEPTPIRRGATLISSFVGFTYPTDSEIVP